MLYAYEKLLNDVYQHILQNPPPKGTKMIKYMYEFAKDKPYYDEWLFEMNMGHAKKYIDEIKPMVESAKKFHRFSKVISG